jgi:hypothetical protein
MHNPKLPKVIPVPERMQKRFGTGTMLVPSPADVDAFIRTVPQGSLTTPAQIRDALAKKFLADVTCPLTTGIFVRIAAEAAEEDARAGSSAITPYWRVVAGDGSLNPKFPGGTDQQAARLRAEGHHVSQGCGRAHPQVEMPATT